MRWCLTVLVLLAIPGQAAKAACPTTWCNLYYAFATVSSSPQGTVGMNEQSFYGQSRTDVSWNAPLGELAVIGSYISGTALPAGDVATTDDFEILGAPPGVPVRVIVWLEGSGYHLQVGGNYSTFSGTLSDDAGRSVRAGPEPPNVLRLALPFDFVAGSPQRITYRLTGWATKLPVSARARLRFDGLPAGMAIVSCRGFQSGAITPARSATWGALKKLYR